MQTSEKKSKQVLSAFVETLEGRQLFAAAIPTGYQLVETLTLNSTSSSPKTFATNLSNAGSYFVVASGTPRIGYTPSGGIRRTDAKYHDAQAEAGVYSQPPVAGRNAGRFVFTGVADPDGDGNFDWGSYQPDHVYGVAVTGTTSPFSVQFADSNYQDNAGSMTVQLYEPLLPEITITSQEQGDEGRFFGYDDSTQLGFRLFRSDGLTATQPLTVNLEYGGNALIGQDVGPVPPSVTFQPGETEAFINVLMTEDVVPEWTELFQARILPSASYRVPQSQSDYASLTILDDDYFYIGSFDAAEIELPFESTEVIDDVETTTSGTLKLESDGNEFHAVAGLADGDWLPRVNGEVTSGGPDYREFWDLSVDFQSDGSYTPTLAATTPPPPPPPPAPNEEGDPLFHARNIAILTDHEPGYTFKFNVGGNNYIGTDPNGRKKHYSLKLEQTAYFGKHKGWYLKFNDDGSVDRWGGEFVKDPQLIGRVRDSHMEIQQKLNLLNDKFFEGYVDQLDEQRVARENFDLFRNALKETLQGATSLAPGAVVIDMHQGLTGEDAYNPGAQLSGGQRVASLADAGSAGAVGALLAARKLATTITEYRRVGRAFQGEVQKALGEVAENTTKYQVTLKTGKIYRTIPDIVSIAGNSIIEIKRRTKIESYTPQLQAQLKLVEDTPGAKYRPILAGGTSDDLAGPFKDAVRRLAIDLGRDVKVLKFDTATKTTVQIYP